MDTREQRGIAIAALCRITRKDDAWLVPSQSGAGHYKVHLNPPSPEVPMCNCPDYEERGQPCKHVFAVQYAVRRETHADGSVTLTEMLVVTEQTTAEKPTYKQNWPAYNLAQTNEKAKFQELLHDLCNGIEEPPANKRGRPRNRLADMVFAGTFKVYSTFSGRRFQTDLGEAQAKGYLSKTPSYNSVFDYLEDPILTPILTRLVIQSSLPLKAVEEDFAVDSTGFTSSRFDRWYDHKYGKFVKKHTWVKVHVMTGVKTNVITAVEIHGKDANDYPQLPPLVKTTAKSFEINEVSADKEYLGIKNTDAIEAVGGVPYIAIKKNTSGSVGGSFEKMYHAYCLNREDFLSHYHKRSNVESTFAMVKAKTGDYVRSKTDVAMANEALCKILCHNLCCLIQSAYELGIVATFWQGEEVETEAEAEEMSALEAPVVAEDVPMEAWEWV